MIKPVKLKPCFHAGLIICFLLFSQVSFTQEARKFSLEEAIKFALENNYDALNASKDLTIAKKQVREATAIGLPQVNATANFQNFLDIPTQVLPANAFNPQADPDQLVPIRFGTDYTAQGALEASQIIFDGAYIVGLKASKTFQLFSRQNLQRTKADVANEVKQAYFNALVARENYEINENTYENIEKNLSETKIMFEEGFSEEQDVEQLELTLLNLKNALNRADRQREISEKLLKFRLGIDVEEMIELTDELETFTESLTNKNHTSGEVNINDHIDYKVADTRVELDNLSLQRERSEYLPKLNAFFSYRQDAFRNDLEFTDTDGWFPATIWGVNLSVPIFSSGMRHSKVQQAKIEMEKSKTDRDMMEQNIRLQIATARKDFEVAEETYHNQKKSMDLSERILNKTLVKHQEGVASSFELTQMQNQFLEAQGNYINALFDLMNAKAALDRALGRM